MPTKRAVYDLSELKFDGPGRGTFTALVSVYGNVDRVGDRVMPGAFDKSLERWKTAGDPIPVIWSHDWANPDAHIGEIDPANAVSTERGLQVTGRLDVDEPFAAKVYKLLKARRIKQWSFAYDILDERSAKDGANELHELEIGECGPCLKGANAETDTIAVKHEGEDPHAKGGRGPATDDSDWDGGAAMTAVDTAAGYRAICAGERTEGEPDERAHWALPHHKSPGAPANAAGVRAARARFDQTEGLANRDDARRHLFEVHKLPSEQAAADLEAIKAQLAEDRAKLYDVDTKIDKVLARLDGVGDAEIAAVADDETLATQIAVLRQELSGL